MGNKLKQTKMTLTKKQNEELDSLKNQIESIENKIETAQANLSIAQDLEDLIKIKSIESAIDFGQKEIKRMVSIQSQSMKLEYNLVLDLIFDREYTLSLL